MFITGSSRDVFAVPRRRRSCHDIFDISARRPGGKVEAVHSPASLPAGLHLHPRFQRREERSNLTRGSEKFIISDRDRCKKDRLAAVPYGL